MAGTVKEVHKIMSNAKTVT